MLVLNINNLLDIDNDRFRGENTFSGRLPRYVAYLLLAFLTTVVTSPFF
ncbi:MAG: hypothetical protein ACSLEL_00940 [Candidatus Malihini olakiniferum]